MDAQDLQYGLGMIGTVAFSVTAVLAVIPKRIDVFGACVMAVITAVGGGTIRDVILEVPVFWGQDLNYIWVALVSALIAFYGYRFMSNKIVYSLMLYMDAIGIAVFVIQAAEKTRILEFAMPVGPILLGLTTAIGGGILRDVIAGNTTLLMRKELYAVPLTVGAILYLILVSVFENQLLLIGSLCALFTFVFRAIAIYNGLTVPDWMLLKKHD